MAASLARAAGMQLQLAAGQQLEPLAVALLQGSMLSQQGPWDAGLLAVRVDGSSSSGSGSSSESSGSDSRCERSSGIVEQAGYREGGQAAHSRIEAVAADTEEQQTDLLQVQQQQQQQQQRQQRLVVELVAAFTSPSFAVGWVGSGPQARQQVVVLRRQGVAAAAADDLPEEDLAGGLGSQFGVQAEVKCMEVCCSWPLV
jgi:hypothetical protein